MRRALAAATAVLLVALALVAVAPPAGAAPTVARAELSGGRLRVEGRSAVAGGTVTIASPTAGEPAVSVAADGRGEFRAEADGFRSSTCRVTVSDATGTTSAPLSGCTPTATTTALATTTTTGAPATTTTTAPSAGCTITPQPPATYHVGDLQTYFWSTTGCRSSDKPVQWSLVSGRIPPGMSGPHLQGVGSGFVTGRPTTVGTFTFTVRVTDQVGARDTETFTITVEPARPVTVTTQGFLPGRVGEFYCCGNLFADGGVPGYTWSITGGGLPPGLSLQRSPGRITGTPTAAGTFTFTVQPTDGRGVRGTPKAFELVIEPAA